MLPSTVAEQHRSIRDVVTRLRRSSDLAVIASLLVELDSLLRPHFEEEERPGGLIDAIGSSPFSQHRVLARIMVDHRMLASASEDALRATRECLDGPVERVLGAVRLLCDQIISHEQRETEAALDAVSAAPGDRGALRDA